MRPPLIFAFAMAVGLLPLAGSALEDDRDQPIRIKARHVSMDEKSGKTVYVGNVEAVQGSLRLTADRAVVVRRNGRTEHIHATGRPVTMKQKPDPVSPEIHAEARRLEYSAANGEVELFDEVIVTQAQDELKSAYVYYKIDGSVMRARAGDDADKRVQAILHPPRKDQDLP